MTRIFIFSKRKMILGLGVFVGMVFVFIAAVFLLNGFNAEPTYAPIYQGKTDEKNISLTINVDWGEEFIPNILDVLDQKQVKATFFITGRWAEKFPNLVKEINNKGHEIGNHGYSHPHPDKLTVELNKKEIVRTQEIIKKITDKKTTLFASPYGEKGKNVVKAAESLDYAFIMWTKDTIDWQDPNPETIVRRVLNDPVNGTIILMHPRKNSLQALPKIIDGYINYGFTFKVVSEII